jgi:hypothetical protein
VDSIPRAEPLPPVGGTITSVPRTPFTADATPRRSCGVFFIPEGNMLNGNVVAIPQKPKPLQVYTCGCGSQQWFLLADGQCVCAGCNCVSKRLVCYDVPPGPAGHA